MAQDTAYLYIEAFPALDTAKLLQLLVLYGLSVGICGIQKQHVLSTLAASRTALGLKLSACKATAFVLLACESNSMSDGSICDVCVTALHQSVVHFH